MKIIRVSGCHDCNYPDSEFLPPYIPCTHPDSPNNFNICHFIESKSLPDNCSLEEMLSETEASLSQRPKTGFGASFDFLDDEGEDIYTASGLSETGAEGELITFKNKKEGK